MMKPRFKNCAKACAGEGRTRAHVGLTPKLFMVFQGTVPKLVIALVNWV
jgi:hypothetical protein